MFDGEFVELFTYLFKLTERDERMNMPSGLKMKTNIFRIFLRITLPMCNVLLLTMIGQLSKVRSFKTGLQENIVLLTADMVAFPKCILLEIYTILFFFYLCHLVNVSISYDLVFSFIPLKSKWPFEILYSVDEKFNVACNAFRYPLSHFAFQLWILSFCDSFTILTHPKEHNGNVLAKVKRIDEILRNQNFIAVTNQCANGNR